MALGARVRHNFTASGKTRFSISAGLKAGLQGKPLRHDVKPAAPAQSEVGRGKVSFGPEEKHQRLRPLLSFRRPLPADSCPLTTKTIPGG